MEPEPLRILRRLDELEELAYTVEAFADADMPQWNRALALMADLCRAGRAGDWTWL